MDGYRYSMVDKECGCTDKEFRIIIQKNTIICFSCKFELFVSECRVKHFSCDISVKIRQ